MLSCSISAFLPVCFLTWKLAMVTPDPKKGNPHELNNYTRISVLNVISKIFEKVVHGIYVSLRPQIVPHQHRFMSKRSTATNLVEIMNYHSCA